MKNAIENTIGDPEHTILSVALSILISIVWNYFQYDFCWCLYGFGILVKNGEKARFAGYETAILKE